MHLHRQIVIDLWFAAAALANRPRDSAGAASQPTRRGMAQVKRKLVDSFSQSTYKRCKTLLGSHREKMQTWHRWFFCVTIRIVSFETLFFTLFDRLCAVCIRHNLRPNIESTRATVTLPLCIFTRCDFPAAKRVSLTTLGSH